METLSVPPKIVRAHEDGSTDIYYIRRSIGKGGFSTVFEASLFRTNQTFAIKAISLENVREKSQVKNQLEETKIQCSLNHPNILRAYDFFQDGVNFYIILEYCPYHSVYNLFKQQRKFSELDTADIIKQVLEGVQYLHQNLVIHRDIKPQNLLIGSDGKIKISDFGISTKLTAKTQRCHTTCGTRGFMCPEMIKKEQDGYGFESDIWAIGVCTYLFLTGSHPFLTFDKRKTETRILNNDYSFPSKLQLSSSSKDFIRKILQTNPSKRPTINLLLKHPFITNSQKTPHQHFFQLLKSDKPTTADPNTNADKPPPSNPQKNAEKPPTILPQKNQEKPQIISPKKNKEKPQINGHKKNVSSHPHLQKKLDSINNNHQDGKHEVVVKIYKIKKVRKKVEKKNDEDDGQKRSKQPSNVNHNKKDREDLPPLKKEYSSMSDDDDHVDDENSDSSSSDINDRHHRMKRQGADRKKESDQQRGKPAKLPPLKIPVEQDNKQKNENSSSFKPDKNNNRSPRKQKPPQTDQPQKQPNLQPQQKPQPDQQQPQQPQKQQQSPQPNLLPQKQPQQQKQEQILNHDDKYSHENDKYLLKKTSKDFLMRSLFKPERNDPSPRKESPSNLNRQPIKPTRLPPLKQPQDTDDISSSKLEMYGRPQPTETLKRKRHQTATTAANLPQNLHNIPSYCIINFYADNEKGEMYYFMKNGQVGMISGDQQRIVLDPHGEFIQIWSKIEDYKPDTFSLEEAKEFENVSKLLKYEKIFKESNLHQLEMPNAKHPETIPMRHVKYCMNNENGMMFRMDNRVTQMNFPDKSKLIVFWEQKSLISAHSLFRNGLYMTFDGLKKSGNEELKKKYSIAKKMIELICK